MKKFIILEFVGAVGFIILITVGVMGAWFIYLYNM